MSWRLTGVSVLCVALAGTSAISTTAVAGSSPKLKVSTGNAVPECTTPERLMTFLETTNSNIDARFSTIASSYKSIGTDLKIRWDYAFFQMMVETGRLSFARDGKPIDVRPAQNNFASLGAVGPDEPGEQFATVDLGVRAHLQHITMYAGETVAEPVAERTRKVQDWGVIKTWQKSLKHATTFEDLAQKWSPQDQSYWAEVDRLATSFSDRFCSPAATLKAETATPAISAAAAGTDASEPSKWAGGISVAAPQKSDVKGSGAELAQLAIERARTDGDSARSGLGAGSFAQPYLPAQPLPPTAEARIAAPTNPSARSGKSTTATSPSTATSAVGAATRPVTTVAVVIPPQAAAPIVPALAQPVPAARCRVYTASYGGNKSVIIRQIGDHFANYTVLEVNDTDENLEVGAFIDAYARNGLKIGDFRNQPEALDEAFKLCPEG